MQNGDVLLCLVGDVHTVTITACDEWENRARHQASVSFNKDFAMAKVTMLQNKTDDERRKHGPSVTCNS